MQATAMSQFDNPHTGDSPAKAHSFVLNHRNSKSVGNASGIPARVLECLICDA
jgi:hypothetical protein